MLFHFVFSKFVLINNFFKEAQNLSGSIFSRIFKSSKSKKKKKITDIYIIYYILYKCYVVNKSDIEFKTQNKQKTKKTHEHEKKTF